ncbi:aldehyde ferredoxin oxidoreductase N-terminal domain-containing protein, partial [Thermodesulfobacteriota bacterium]
MDEQSYGWTGTILRVDLTRREFSTEPTMNYARRFIGGRGIQQWILFREVASHVQPFDPENLLIFGTGRRNEERLHAKELYYCLG